RLLGGVALATAPDFAAGLAAGLAAALVAALGALAFFVSVFLASVLAAAGLAGAALCDHAQAGASSTSAEAMRVFMVIPAAKRWWTAIGQINARLPLSPPR